MQPRGSPSLDTPLNLSVSRCDLPTGRFHPERDIMANKALADAYDKAIQHFWVALPSNRSVDDKVDSRTHLAIGMQLFCDAVRTSVSNPDPLFDMAISHFKSSQQSGGKYSQQALDTFGQSGLDEFQQYLHLVTGMQQFCAAVKNNFVKP
jgi:hypothetical protein